MQKFKRIFASLLGSIRRQQKNKPPPKLNTVYPGGPGRDPGSRSVDPAARRLFEDRLDRLTGSRIWDWNCFRGVLICLASIGEGKYIPARSRPNVVYLDGLNSTFSDLRQLSAQRFGRETSRVVFVDRGRSCLVISGKTNVGTNNRVNLLLTPEPGRESVQLPIITIHVHPDQHDAAGLSHLDYISFLSDRRQIVMFICYSSGILFSMKTSVTPSTISPVDIQRMISTIHQDIARIWSGLGLPKAQLALNKAVCSEFGMTLYQTSTTYPVMARRIEVTAF